MFYNRLKIFLKMSTSFWGERTKRKRLSAFGNLAFVIQLDHTLSFTVEIESVLKKSP